MSHPIKIGTLEEIPRQGSRIVRTETWGDLAIFRTLSDSVYALVDRCPHKGGPLSQGIVHGEKVTCPLHNWTIDLVSGVAVAPDKGCVKHFPVAIEVKEGTLFIALEPKNAENMP